MKILQFAFDSRDENDYLPHKYEENSVAYTGTHDNETVVGWYDTVNVADKKICDAYIGKIKEVTSPEINWKFIETVWNSDSIMALAQMQDFLGIDSVGRMNIPSVPSGNWQWRLDEELLTDELVKRIGKLTKKFER